MDGVGGVSLSYMCPHGCCFPLEDCIWWVSSGQGQKQCNWWCAACGQCNWRAPNRVLVTQDSTDHRNANVLRAHAPQGMCDNLITHVKKVLVTQQKDGHSPVRMIVPVLLEESRREMMGGLRSFTAVDTCAAVATGDLQKEL